MNRCPVNRLLVRILHDLLYYKATFKSSLFWQNVLAQSKPTNSLFLGHPFGVHNAYAIMVFKGKYNFGLQNREETFWMCRFSVVLNV